MSPLHFPNTEKAMDNSIEHYTKIAKEFPLERRQAVAKIVMARVRAQFLADPSNDTAASLLAMAMNCHKMEGITNEEFYHNLDIVGGFLVCDLPEE